MTYESPEERRQRAGIIEVPLPGKSAKKLNGGSHNGAERRHGNGATRGQIEGVDFRPEIESHKAERAQSEPLPVAPAPAYVSVFPFTMSERGLFKRIRAKGADGGDEEGDEDTAVEKHVLRTVHVSAPFEILGKCRDPDGNSQGLLLRWSDDDGRTHIQFVPYSALYGDAAALCGGLADGGLPVDERRVRDIKRYFRSVEVDARVTRVTRTGWHEICGKKVFVLPGGTIGNDSSEVVMLDGSDKAPYEVNGTIDSWRDNIAKPAGDHLLLRLAISTALAGSLLYLADAESGGVNFYGSSSKGKTTVLRVAASVWGNGNSIKTWSATGNSFEASAVVTTDTFLAIDEIGMAGTREVFSALYTLANGQGKSRLNRDASMRPTRAWRVMVASTGEVPVETKLAEDNGRKAHAGQLVRMIDVPATERACGAFDSATDGDSRALADKFKLAASTHYGTAGPEFVRRLIVDGVDGDAIRELINGFAKANVPPGSDGQIERVAGRFGIIAAAGEMAIEFGLTGWDKGAATAAAAWAFSQWIEAQGGGAIEERQAIAQVRQIIEQYGDSRFQSLADSDGRPVNDRLGWRQNTADGPEWYATPENFKTQICAGLNPQKVAKSLSERGMLRKQKGPGYQCSIRIGADKLKVYALKNILEEGQET
jgi:putative DNA primase/helicase